MCCQMAFIVSSKLLETTSGMIRRTACSFTWIPACIYVLCQYFPEVGSVPEGDRKTGRGFVRTESVRSEYSASVAVQR